MRGAQIASAMLGLLSLAGCSGSLSEKLDDPMSLPRMIIAGTNQPPGQLTPSGRIVQPGTRSVPLAPEDVHCPSIGVAEGGSAIQVSRSQITLGQLARECLGQGDGSTLVKVGVQSRALLGPGGAAGRFDVPVRVVVRQGDRVLASRVRRLAVQIPAGDSQGSFALVEEGIVVPPSAAEDFEIEVGLGAGGAGQTARRRG